MASSSDKTYVETLAKLKGDGFALAAEALAFQANVRSLPPREKDTLLVHAVPKKSEGSMSLGTSVAEVASANRPVSSLSHSSSVQVFSASLSLPPHPSEVSTLSGRGYREDLPKHLVARCKVVPHDPQITPEVRVQKILRAQDPKTVSRFKVLGVDSADLLPGGVPLLDHAIGFLSPQPAWETTVKVLKEFATLRITSPDSLPEIRELNIGLATPSECKEVGEWLDVKHRRSTVFACRRWTLRT